MLMTHFLFCFLFLFLIHLNLPADSRHPTTYNAKTMSPSVCCISAAQTSQFVNNMQISIHENITYRKRLVPWLYTVLDSSLRPSSLCLLRPLTPAPPEVCGHAWLHLSPLASCALCPAPGFQQGLLRAIQGPLDGENWPWAE